MFKHVDLCSGIGGFALGFEWAGLSEPVLFCDMEPWSRKVLAKHWPDVPIAEDVKELANDPNQLVPDCDILTAGYPCQPFSLAGERRGTEDDRHIWPYIFTIIQRKRPSWCVFENVYGHVSMGLDEVLSDLEGQGYAARPFIVPACGVDAPHRRDRVWIVGYTEDNGCEWRCEATGREGQTHQLQQQLSVRGEPSRPSENVANTSGQRLQGSKRLRQNEEEAKERREGANESAAQCSDDARRQTNFWLPEPRICHLDDGLPSRMDGFDGWEREPEDIPRVATGVADRVSRLRGLGNAIVPAIAMRIGQTIKAVHHG